MLAGPCGIWDECVFVEEKDNKLCYQNRSTILICTSLTFNQWRPFWKTLYLYNGHCCRSYQRKTRWLHFMFDQSLWNQSFWV